MPLPPVFQNFSRAWRVMTRPFAAQRDGMDAMPSALPAPTPMEKADRAFVQKLDHIAAAQSYPEGRKPEYIWSGELFREIADLSLKLAEQHPNTRFFGLGNSPSYIIHGIGQTAAARGTGVETGHIPFSGRYMRVKNHRQWRDLEMYLLSSSRPYNEMRANRDAYRQHLAGMGLHPKSIVRSFRATGQKTAFVDNIVGASGFASFIHFMHEWARDEKCNLSIFGHATRFVALTQTLRLGDHLSIPEAGISVPVEKLRISQKLAHAANGNMSLDTDRFVPSYKPEQWSAPPPRLPAVNQAIAQLVKQRVRQAVRDAEAQRPRALLAFYPRLQYSKV